MNENSNFWMDGINDLEKLRETDNLQYLLRLSSYKNSISNFVNIMTGRNDIKVKFNVQNKSFTDGKIITIGSDISGGNIDPSVGIALHESAHIVKTDMNYFKTFWCKIPSSITKAAKTKGYKENTLSELSTNVLNYIEDRYIDNWTYNSCPGYRGYYDKMYEKYWHNKEISDGLKSCFFRTCNLESYMFRLINMINVNSDLSALPGLIDIHNIIDFRNIDRLDNQEKRGKLAFDVVRIIVDNLGENLELDYMDQLEQNNPPKTESDNQQKKEEDLDEDDSSDQNQESDKKEDKKEIDIPTSLKGQLKEQLDFLKGNISKSELTEKECELMDNIEKSETILTTSGGTDGIPIIPCVVIKKINRDTISSGIIPMSIPGSTPSIDSVENGITMGTILGKKLQIRGEIKSTKFNRLVRGKIDKRLLSGLGYNNANVFYNVNVDEYKKVFIHISVDASYSMRQESKWEQVMTCTVAICKAVSMINNINVCVSFRSTTDRSEGSSLPVVVVAYDSRVDKFSKVIQLFPSFCPNGATPEGLSFQSILNLIPKANHELDVYFLNFSDGEPSFSYTGKNYRGNSAANHTKRQVDKIRSSGSEVMSYFVGKNDKSDLFKIMYGPSAKMINVTDILSVAKTLNDKFLEKNKD